MSTWQHLFSRHARAVGVALLARGRRRYGRRVVLCGPWRQCVICVVVVSVVILGGGIEERAAPQAAAASKTVLPEKGDTLPPVVNADTVYAWLLHQAPPVRGDARGSPAPWLAFKEEFFRIVAKEPPLEAEVESLRKQAGGLPNLLQPIVLADLDARRQGKPAPGVPASKLLLALDELERHGFFDHGVSAYLWRKTANGLAAETVKDGIELYARLHRHARITEALIRAQAIVKPGVPPGRAWLSKAEPTRVEHPETEQFQKSVAALVQEAGTCYGSAGPGTWEREALVAFRSAADGLAPTLIRAGKARALAPGERFHFGRLDLLETPAGERPVVLEQVWLGKFELPAGQVLSVWELPDWSPNEARTKLLARTKEALAGSRVAADELEKVLPLAQPFIRDALAPMPQAKGVPALRLLLRQFDETPMPELQSGNRD